jgi:hypothetical protein
MDATRFGDFFDGGSPMGFFGFLGSFMGDFVGDGGSFLSAGAFVFLVRICLDPSITVLLIVPVVFFFSGRSSDFLTQND